MKQKVIQIGSSAGVTIPKEALEDLGVQVGDTIETASSAGLFTVKPTAPQVKLAEKDIEFAAWLESAIEQYRPALEALKNK